MSEIKTVKEMIAYLAAHGVEENSLYTVGGLGGGEIDGIEFIDGVWHTYFSERGAKRGYKAWATETEAIAYILPRTVEIAKTFGLWKDK